MTQNIGLCFLRVAVSLSMLTHGWGKLTNFAEIVPNFPDPIGVGSQVSLALVVFAEFFCAIFVIAGLLTRWVSIPLIITMLVAVLSVHGADAFGKKEKGVIYLICYVTIALLGAGDWSLDRILLKKKN